MSTCILVMPLRRAENGRIGEFFNRSTSADEDICCCTARLVNRTRLSGGRDPKPMITSETDAQSYADEPHMLKQIRLQEPSESVVPMQTEQSHTNVVVNLLSHRSEISCFLHRIDI